MKTLFVAPVAGRSASFSLFTKAPAGKHQRIPFATGTYSGGTVALNVVAPNLAGNVTYDNPLAAIAAATKEGYAVVAADAEVPADC